MGWAEVDRFDVRDRWERLYTVRQIASWPVGPGPTHLRLETVEGRPVKDCGRGLYLLEARLGTGELATFAWREPQEEPALAPL